MNQNERREYLIKYLLKEEIRFGRQSIPADKQGPGESVALTYECQTTKTNKS